MRARIEVTKNSQGRVESGKIYEGRKVFSFRNGWDDEGHLASIEFSGKDLPSPSELYHFMNDKFIERIRRIDLIDLISEITVIGEIKRVHIEPISKLPNGDFEVGSLEGWDQDFCTIETSEVHSGSYACKLYDLGGGASIYRFLPPFSSDTVFFSIWHKSSNLGDLTVKFEWTDGTSNDYTQTGNNAWQFFAPALAAGKRMKQIIIYHTSPLAACYIDDVNLV